MTTAMNTSPETLRAHMVDAILDAGHAQSTAVRDALRSVPRHLFVPDASIEDAYADIAVITKHATDGTALSCASVPTIVAMMLDQLDVQPGHRVLEIGAGTGYNAALLAQLTGTAGQVTTVDIDPDITAQARHALDSTGNHRVRVITRDGALGAQEHAPYDRIIFTVGAWDLPPAIWNQLAPDGKLVVPLRWRGQTRSIAFRRDRDTLESDAVELCGFVPMIGQDGEHTATIDPDGHVALFWDSDQKITPAVLGNVLHRPRLEAWSNVFVGPEDPFDGIWLHLTATEPGTCRIAIEPAAIESGLCTPAIPSRSPALVEGDSLAYLTLRRIGDQPRWELGAISHGAVGRSLADRICTAIKVWDTNRIQQPAIIAYPADTAILGEQVIRKDHSQLLVSYSN